MGAATGAASNPIWTGSSSRSRGVAGSSDTSAAVKKSRSVAHTVAIGVPVKISAPSIAKPRHTIAAPIGETTLASGCATSAPITPPACGNRVVAVGRGGIAAQQRQQPQDRETEHREPDEHPDPLLARRVAEQQDPPIDPDQGEGDRGDAPRATEGPAEEVTDRPGPVEPQPEHRDQREHDQEDPERVARVREKGSGGRGSSAAPCDGPAGARAGFFFVRR